jgi:Glycosyl transferase family 11
MILIRLMGGLGNQLFQYAAGRALALRNRAPLKLDLTLLEDRNGGEHAVFRNFELGAFLIEAEFATTDEIRYFNPTPKTLFGRIGHRLKKSFLPNRVYLEQGRTFDPTIPELPAPMCIVGSLQSERYFAPISRQLREELTFRDTLCDTARPIATAIDAGESVAVHVRRGDYVSNPHYCALLGAVEPDYYKSAFTFIESRLTNPHYFIFSDDISWCRQHFMSDHSLTFVDAEATGGAAIQDLMLMSSCRHFIIPNSTFGWWGAWLGKDPDKLVIAPRKWSKSGQLDSSDRIPESWHQL